MGAGVILTRASDDEEDEDPSNDGQPERGDEPNPIVAIFDKIANSTIWAVCAVVLGWLVKVLLVLLLTKFN